MSGSLRLFAGLFSRSGYPTPDPAKTTATQPPVSPTATLAAPTLPGASKPTVQAPEFNTTSDPAKNRWLLIREGVMRTQRTDPVIAALDRFFFEARLIQYITSVKRTEASQMALIIKYAKAEGLPVEFTEADVFKTVATPGGLVFVWQMTYSLLLTKGIIINPPVPCKCLTSSIREDGTDRKGDIIGASEHITTDRVFDIGGYDPADPTITNEVVVMKHAIADGMPIVSITIEKKNNCVHVRVV